MRVPGLGLLVSRAWRRWRKPPYRTPRERTRRALLWLGVAVVMFGIVALIAAVS